VAFWSLIGKPLVDYINHSYEFGELSNSQNQAIVVLIEKKGKEKGELKLAAYIADECRCENYFQSFRKGFGKGIV